MKKYDFDKKIDRKNTGCIKWDLIEINDMPSDTLPLWVADMDFETVPEVKEALVSVAQHGIYGYSFAKESYFEAVQNWFETRFSWKPEKEWMIQTPGVVFGLAVAVCAFTEIGDAVLVQRPVYNPFSNVVEKNGRVVVNSPLVYENETYSIDFADFEQKIIENNVKMFILCNPHNPVGRVWTEEELRKIGDICIKHNVFVVSDEIHCDFIYEGYRHINFASLGKAYQQNCMVCTAPSKSFNLAGMQTSNLFIPNEEKRKLLQEELDRLSYHGVGLFGLTACEAAYRYGAQWMDELVEYLQGNVAYVKKFVAERLPKIKMVEPQGTYLLWFDMSGYGYTKEQLKEKLAKDARLWLNEGGSFGPEGDDFVRVNIACQRSILEEAMERFLVL